MKKKTLKKQSKLWSQAGNKQGKKDEELVSFNLLHKSPAAVYLN